MSRGSMQGELLYNRVTGVEKHRTRTNPYWIIIFAISFAIWITTAFYAVSFGHPKKIFFKNIDSDGRVCGVDSGVSDKPYVFYVDFMSCTEFDASCTTKGVCLASCPQNNFIVRRKNTSLKDIKSRIICMNDVLRESDGWIELDKHIENGKCTKWYLKSEPMGRVCVPREEWRGHEFETIDLMNLVILKHVWRNAGDEPIYDKWTRELHAFLTANRWRVAVLTIVSIAACLYYLIVLRCQTILVTYTSVCIICAFLLANLYVIITTYPHGSFWIGLGRLAGVMFATTLLFLIAGSAFRYRHTVRVACNVLLHTTSPVGAAPVTLLLSVLPGLLQILLALLCINVALYLHTITVPIHRMRLTSDSCICPVSLNYVDNAPCDPYLFRMLCSESGFDCSTSTCQFIGFIKPWYINVLHVINALGFYWFYSFISVLSKVSFAGGFATWYWRSNNQKPSHLVYMNSALTAITYHVGTISCMSFIWTSCRLIRMLLKQFTQFYPDCNPTLDLFYNKFFKLVKRKTYIISAVRGKALYDSMLEYDNVVKQHNIRDEFIETIAHLILFGAKLILIILTIVLVHCYDQNLTIVITFVMIILSKSIFSLYEVALETVLFCYYEDCVINVETEEKLQNLSLIFKEILR